MSFQKRPKLSSDRKKCAIFFQSFLTFFNSFTNRVRPLRATVNPYLHFTPAGIRHSSAVCKMPAGTSIHMSALDGIVNVNSMFTLAVFLGLAWNPNDATNNLVESPNCLAGPSVAENLVAFHVYSFSSFLFSSLIALGLKQAIRISKSPFYHPTEFFVRVNKTAVRIGMLVSGIGSVCGCGFLMMALINVVQIKLGTLSCGSSQTYAAVVPLVILVPFALVIYICLVSYAFIN